MMTFIPTIYVKRLVDGLIFFQSTLGFNIKVEDEEMAFIWRDGAKAHLVENAERASSYDQTGITLETTSPADIYEIAERHAFNSGESMQGDENSLEITDQSTGITVTVILIKQ